METNKFKNFDYSLENIITNSALALGFESLQTNIANGGLVAEEKYLRTLEFLNSDLAINFPRWYASDFFGSAAYSTLGIMLLKKITGDDLSARIFAPILTTIAMTVCFESLPVNPLQNPDVLFYAAGALTSSILDLYISKRTEQKQEE